MMEFLNKIMVAFRKRHAEKIVNGYTRMLRKIVGGYCDALDATAPAIGDWLVENPQAAEKIQTAIEAVVACAPEAKDLIEMVSSLAAVKDFDVVTNVAVASFEADVAKFNAVVDEEEANPENKVVHRGEVFIVPNSLASCEDFYAEPSCVRVGVADQDDLLVEVWMTGEGIENWNCHGHPVALHSLPVSLFSNKKEGDTVSFSYKDNDGVDRHVFLTLAQLTHRYCHRGPFEECLAALKKSYENK